MAAQRPSIRKPKKPKKPSLPLPDREDIRDVLAANGAFNRIFDAANRLAMETIARTEQLPSSSLVEERERLAEIQKTLEQRKSSIKSQDDPAVQKALEALGRSPEEILGTLVKDGLKLMKECPRLVVMRKDKRRETIESVLRRDRFTKRFNPSLAHHDEEIKECKLIIAGTVIDALAAIVTVVIVIIATIAAEVASAATATAVVVILIILEILVFLLVVASITINHRLAWHDAGCP